MIPLKTRGGTWLEDQIQTDDFKCGTTKDLKYILFIIKRCYGRREGIFKKRNRRPYSCRTLLKIYKESSEDLIVLGNICYVYT